MIPLSFVTASIAAELDDYEKQLHKLYWGGSTASALVDHFGRIQRIRKLLEEAEKHVEADDRRQYDHEREPGRNEP